MNDTKDATVVYILQCAIMTTSKWFTSNFILPLEPQNNLLQKNEACHMLLMFLNSVMQFQPIPRYLFWAVNQFMAVSGKTII